MGHKLARLQKAPVTGVGDVHRVLVIISLLLRSMLIGRARRGSRHTEEDDGKVFFSFDADDGKSCGPLGSSSSDVHAKKCLKLFLTIIRDSTKRATKSSRIRINPNRTSFLLNHETETC